jgi:hypothetical protein
MMINTTTNDNEQQNEDKKANLSFFTRSTLNKAQTESSLSAHENDDTTPFYVLGYN